MISMEILLECKSYNHAGGQIVSFDHAIVDHYQGEELESQFG